MPALRFLSFSKPPTLHHHHSIPAVLHRLQVLKCHESRCEQRFQVPVRDRYRNGGPVCSV